jgi:hypothetical protein
MSNKIVIQKTEFKNIPQGDILYGYRMYDDYDQTYGNIMEKEDMELPPLEFIQKIEPYFDEAAHDMFKFALHEKHGIEIDGKYYTLTFENGRYKLT